MGGMKRAVAIELGEQEQWREVDSNNRGNRTETMEGKGDYGIELSTDKRKARKRTVTMRH